MSGGAKLMAAVAAQRTSMNVEKPNAALARNTRRSRSYPTSRKVWKPARRTADESTLAALRTVAARGARTAHDRRVVVERVRGLAATVRLPHLVPLGVQLDVHDHLPMRGQDPLQRARAADILLPQQHSLLDAIARLTAGLGGDVLHAQVRAGPAGTSGGACAPAGCTPSCRCFPA